MYLAALPIHTVMWISDWIDSSYTLTKKKFKKRRRKKKKLICRERCILKDFNIVSPRASPRAHFVMERESDGGRQVTRMRNEFPIRENIQRKHTVWRRGEKCEQSQGLKINVSVWTFTVNCTMIFILCGDFLLIYFLGLFCFNIVECDPTRILEIVVLLTQGSTDWNLSHISWLTSAHGVYLVITLLLCDFSLSNYFYFKAFLSINVSDKWGRIDTD